MKFRSMLALLALGILCSSASAAVRTFTVNSASGPALLANFGSLQFELQAPSAPNNGLFDNLAYGPELITMNQVMAAGSALSAPATLYGVNHATAGEFLFHFQNTATPTQNVFVTLASGVFGAAASGGDVPDGTDSAAKVVYFDSANVGNTIVASASVTIGTVAVPEPSAFAFGGLAVVATGIGRWVRRRKVTA